MDAPTLNQTFAAREGSRLTDKDAQIVGPELERIEHVRGCLKPAEIVEESRPEEAPLHRFFEWDNSQAAQLYRQEQARTLIRSVVLITVGEQETAPTRAFVCVTQSKSETAFEGSAYISTVRAMRDDDYRGQVLQNAYDELSAFRHRYKHLQELADVIAAIDTVVQ